MKELVNYIQSDNIIYIIRLTISIICGLTIGYERENKNKNAGIRTHGIVALGACLCTILSAYAFKKYGSDPTRIAAQVVSGIGFLGAGIIFVKDKNISGLTTAAGVWTTAIISMAIGTGMILIGIVSTILVVFLQWSLSKLKMKHNFSGEQVISLTIINDIFDLELFIHSLADYNIDILYIETERINKIESHIEATVHLPENFNKWKLNDKFLEINGVKTQKYINF